MRWLDGVTDSVDMSWSKLQEIVKDREAWSAEIHGVTIGYDFVTEQQLLFANQLFLTSHNSGTKSP